MVRKIKMQIKVETTKKAYFHNTRLSLCGKRKWNHQFVSTPKQTVFEHGYPVATRHWLTFSHTVIYVMAKETGKPISVCSAGNGNFCWFRTITSGWHTGQVQTHQGHSCCVWKIKDLFFFVFILVTQPKALVHRFMVLQANFHTAQEGNRQEKNGQKWS